MLSSVEKEVVEQMTFERLLTRCMGRRSDLKPITLFQSNPTVHREFEMFRLPTRLESKPWPGVVQMSPLPGDE